MCNRMIVGCPDRYAGEANPARQAHGGSGKGLKIMAYDSIIYGISIRQPVPSLVLLHLINMVLVAQPSVIPSTIIMSSITSSIVTKMNVSIVPKQCNPT